MPSSFWCRIGTAAPAGHGSVRLEVLARGESGPLNGSGSSGRFRAKKAILSQLTGKSEGQSECYDPPSRGILTEITGG